MTTVTNDRTNVDTLTQRLEAAERVCRFYGLSPSRFTDDDRATFEAWKAWQQIAPSDDAEATWNEMTSWAGRGSNPGPHRD